jgi:TPR repeat protein
MFLWMKKIKEKRLLKKIKSLLDQRKLNQVNDKQLLEEINLLNQLAKLYGQLQKYIKDYPYALEMQVSAYRSAAELNDKEAYLWLAQELLRHARACEQWQLGEVLASDFNHSQQEHYYKQAHAFLELASANNTDAIRLMGLCYIHGWGFVIDRKKGFSLIVDSINKDNSWDKLPEIFSKMGLNKPEFLSELIRFRTTGDSK